MLCYAPCCIGLIFSIVVAIVEKQSRFVRFHAFQSLLLHGIALVLGVGFQIFSLLLSGLGMSMLALILVPVEAILGFGLLALFVVLMVKSYNNEQFEIPKLGEMARGWA
jgi:uncharacterized membrane protein